MEFPHGHHGHRHHRDGDDDDEDRRRRLDEEEEQYRPPPATHNPDPYGRREDRYPEQAEDYLRPPPPRYGRPGSEEGYFGGENVYQNPPHQPPPPSYGGSTGNPSVHHVGHLVDPDPYESSGYGEGGAYGGGRGGRGHGGGGSFFPSRHESHGDGGGIPSGRKTVRVFTKAAEGFSLAVRDGKVVLLRSDPSDDSQHWIKDEKYSTRVKDEEGLPSFALVNKATGQGIKHSIGATHPVQLVPYNPDFLDESVLWTESKDTGEDFRCIRMVNNIRLNFDAFHGDKDHGGVRDGTTVVLWEWLKGENQRWKIVPYCKFQLPNCLQV